MFAFPDYNFQVKIKKLNLLFRKSRKQFKLPIGLIQLSLVKLNVVSLVFTLKTETNFDISAKLCKKPQF